MNFTTLRVSTEEQLMTVVINRPKQLNALNQTVLTELRELFSSLRGQSNFAVRGVMIAGEGGKAFVAGADIKGMNEMSAEQGEAFSALGQEVSQLLSQVPIPVVACVDGYALGGGCELAMGCDLILATSTSTFGQPEVNLGLIPGFGGLARLVRYVGPGLARELIYSGRPFNAEDAKRMGLLNEVYPDRKNMMQAARGLLETIKGKSPYAVAICKEVLNSTYGKTLEAALETEREGFLRAFASEDKREGVNAFMEKRKPAFKGK